MTYNYKVYLPLLQTPELDDPDHSRFDLFTNELRYLSEQIPILQIKSQVFHPKILFQSYTPNTKTIGRETDALMFEVTLPILYDSDKESLNTPIYGLNLGAYHPPGTPEFNKLMNADELISQLFYFMALTQIAYPGTFQTRIMEVFVDNTYYYAGPKFNNLLFDPWLSGFNLNWPNIKTLSIESVWKWYREQGVNFKHFEPGNTTTADKAIGAYLYLLKDEEYSITHHLLWAMRGIEAMFVRGSENITAQINKNSQLILGDLAENNVNVKTIRELYSDRSDFVHGRVSVPHLFSIINFKDKDQTGHYRRVSLNMKLAHSLLIAGIQKMVELNISDFNLQRPRGRKFKNR